jgi:RNA polymerase sigma factor (sigma-70 family)
VKFNYARYRLASLLDSPPQAMSAARARQALLWHRRAMRLRAALVGANMPLVLLMIKRFGTRDMEFAELVSEGNMALLRCVETFDVGRGFKFSTYACRAIIKSFVRLATRTGRYRKRFALEFDPDLDPASHAAWSHEARLNSSVEALRDVLLRNRAGLGDTEQRVVLERFGFLSPQGRRKTLSAIAEDMGLSRERVRQIQQVALAKLRCALEEEHAPARGAGALRALRLPC